MAWQKQRTTEFEFFKSPYYVCQCFIKLIKISGKIKLNNIYFIAIQPFRSANTLYLLEIEETEAEE